MQIKRCDIKAFGQFKRQQFDDLNHPMVVVHGENEAGKSSALIPFFGVPAMTNTAISRIAARTGAVVLPYFCRRLPDAEPRYVASIGAPISEFPSDDAVQDVQRFVQLLEAYIRECPEQYWWIHQRFKGRPDSLPDIYSAPHTTG